MIGHTGRNAGRHVAVAGAALLAAFAASAAAAGPRPDYENARRGVFLRFLNAPPPGEESERSPRLGLSFGGEPRPVLMDTGSTGIVVSASRIPNVDALPSQPGKLTYSSSGRIMIGRWVTVPVTLWGRDGENVSTQPVPVLAVDRIDCTAEARSCRPEDAPPGVAMMGVGFGREGDRQSQSTPDTNPLLAAQPAGPGEIRRGYIVTKDGVHIGLTRANTRDIDRFVKLDANPRYPGDWLGVPACITVNDQAPGVCGRALFDTGVTAMFLTLPQAQVANASAVDDAGRTELAPGTRLTFSFGDAAGYSFAVGDETPLTPTRIFLNTKRPEPFVNTGLHILNGFDMLYDADQGYFGFRTLPARSGS